MGTIELVASVLTLGAVIISFAITRSTSREANFHIQDLLDILRIVNDRFRSR